MRYGLRVLGIRLAIWLVCITPFCIVWYLRATDRIAAAPSAIAFIVTWLLGFVTLNVLVARLVPRRPRPQPRRAPPRPARPMPRSLLMTQAALLLAVGVIGVAELARRSSASIAELFGAAGVALALLCIVWALFHRYGVL